MNKSSSVWRRNPSWGRRSA